MTILDRFHPREVAVHIYAFYLNNPRFGEHRHELW